MNLSTDAAAKEKNKTLFQFDISFDEGESLDTPLLITYREIEALKKKAFEEGVYEGERSVQNSIHAAVDVILQTINAELMSIEEKHLVFKNTLTNEMLTLLQKIVALLLPSLQETVILDEVKALVKSHMESLQEETSLRLVLSSEIYQYLTANDHGKEYHFPENFQLLENPDFSLGEYLLEWPKGSIKKNEQALFEKVVSIVNSMKDHLHPREELEEETQLMESKDSPQGDPKAGEETHEEAPSPIETDEKKPEEDTEHDK